MAKSPKQQKPESPPPAEPTAERVDLVAVSHEMQRCYNRIGDLSALVTRENRNPTNKEAMCIGENYRYIFQYMPSLIEEFRRLHAKYSVDNLDIGSLMPKK